MNLAGAVGVTASRSFSYPISYEGAISLSLGK